MDELTEEIVQGVRAEVEGILQVVTQWAQQGAPGGLEPIEQKIREAFGSVRQRMVRAAIEQVGRGYEGPWQKCQRCGKLGKYVGDRTHTVWTVLGPIRGVGRAYYHGCGCGGGWMPQDQKLGLDAAGHSLVFRQVVSLAGCLGPYEKASETLWEMGRIFTSHTAVEHVTEQEGAQAERWLKGREQKGVLVYYFREPSRRAVNFRRREQATA